jgi:hypothetical protein
MRRLSKAWLAAAIVLAASACGSSDSNLTTPILGASGTWRLQSINGTALPMTLTSGGQSVVVVSSTLTISDNGNYNEVVTLAPVGSTTSSTFTEIGTWTFANGVVTFSDQTDGIVYTGTITGNTLTESSPNFTSVYARQ